VIGFLRDIGFSPEEVNKLLSAIKASSGQRMVDAHTLFKNTQKEFVKKASAAGLLQQDVANFWKMLEGFAGYGFNKAHATAYGILGYRMAYLKTHYPLQFMAAVLETTAGSPKEKPYVQEARRMGLKLLGPDVNVSGVSWTLDVNKAAIRRGLSSVNGVGEKAAKELYDYAPYTSMALRAGDRHARGMGCCAGEAGDSHARASGGCLGGVA
jgi:DNA polymerase-3 subunit alpha